MENRDGPSDSGARCNCPELNQGKARMNDVESYRAELTAARKEIEPCLTERSRPMVKISTRDAEIDVAFELQEEFGSRYTKRTIAEVAGLLAHDQGDWGRIGMVK